MNWRITSGILSCTTLAAQPSGNVAEVTVDRGPAQDDSPHGSANSRICPADWKRSRAANPSLSEHSLKLPLGLALS